MQVLEIWRFPVKSMGGESLTSVELDSRGLVGDRAFAAVDEQGKLASGKNTRRFRRHDEVFGYRAATADDGSVRISSDQRSWHVGDGALLGRMSADFGEAVRVLPEEGVRHHDVSPVSLIGTASLAWCRARLGVDARVLRTRSNLLIETDEPFVEESWVGRAVQVGSSRLQVTARVERCRTIDVAQPGVDGTTAWLKALATARDLQIAVYAEVGRPGSISLGDRLTPT